MTIPAAQISQTGQSSPAPESVGKTAPDLWLSIEAYLERGFIFFSVYTLSIGPMYWSWVDGREAKGSLWITAFYEPLRILGERVPLFGEWLNGYVRWWIL